MLGGYAIRQWLDLGPSEILFLEHAEDTARTTIDAIDIVQVRQSLRPLA
jgi:hypothetical protein